MKIWSSGGDAAVLGDIAEHPGTLYESAEIDGAGMWAKFKHITIPLITPIIFMMSLRRQSVLSKSSKKPML